MLTGDSSKKGGKTVNYACSKKEKNDKRTHSDIAEDSVERNRFNWYSQ